MKDLGLFGIEPVSPAYGRSYNTADAVLEAWKSGKDFKASSGQYCSIRDLKALGADSVMYRDKQRTLVLPVES